MNYHVYKLTESTNQYFCYFIIPYDGNDQEILLDFVDLYLSCAPEKITQYISSLDPDTMKIEKVTDVTPLNVINKCFQPCDKNMFTSDSFVALIPPPKQKRVAKPKADKKSDPKPKGKKSTQKVSKETTAL